MPGICGVIKRELMNGLQELGERMLHAMDQDGRMRIDRFFDGERGMAMGRVSLGVLNPVDQPVSDPEGQCRIVFHGELYRDHAHESDPEYILRQYFEKGDDCACELNGIFHFAVYDGRSEELKLFIDKFGLQPLYYARLPDGFAFAGEVKALIEDPALDRTPDYRSIGDFLHFGQILGQKTLFEHVTLLAPGSVLTVNVRTGECSLRCYWRLQDLFAERGAYDRGLSSDLVVAELCRAVARRSGNHEVLGLSLSGGLDSRGILAALGDRARDIFTYTLGLDGCADQKLAADMARIAGTRHEFIELGKSYIENFHDMALSMIRLSDGMYHPHESTEMLALEYFERAPFRVLLRGHGGETAKAALAYPVMVNPEVYSCSNGSEVLAYIHRTANLVLRDVDPGKLFTPFFFDVLKEAPMHSLRESCGGVSENLAPPDVCLFYYISEHIRRQVVASLEIFRTRVEIRMPYVDEIYLDRLLKLPVAQRNRGEVHHRLVNQCMPALVKVPDSNTGAPLDAGPVRLFITDKFHSLMKRLSVKGFRHYTEFQKWHREGFSRSSQEIIFSDRTASRNMYNMDYMAGIFESHITGQKDYAHLLGTIVGLELWFRCFAD